MNQKFGKNLFIIVFLVGICFPPLWQLTASRFFRSENYENRMLAEMPVLSSETYGSFAGDFESYFNDNLPFRNELISLNSRIDYYLFDESSSDCVIKGKDGWLFYSDKSDGDPVAHYEGTNLMSKKRLKALAKNLVKIQDSLAKQGTEFVAFIAPNKERIYADKMPDCYGAPAENYLTLQIVNYLRDNTDIRVVYPYEELMEARDQLSEPLYFKTDTHWNALGAYIGAKALLSELGIEMPAVSDKQLSIALVDNAPSDLANMLNMSSVLVGDRFDYILSGYPAHNLQTIAWDFSTEFHYQSAGADPRKLLIVRDSFCTSMAEYLASQFSESYMIHRNVYSPERFSQCKPDIVVLETAERYVGILRRFALL